MLKIKLKRVYGGSKLQLKYIDCHCHLADKYFFNQIKELVIEWEKLGVKKIGAMTINPKTAKRNLELVKSYPKLIVLAIGRHPWGAHKFTEEEKLEFEELAQNKKTQVIGEIGLDCYFVKDKGKYEKQIAMFEFFMELAEKYSKPIMLHTTGAERDITNILTTKSPKVNVCCHWFSGPKKELDKLIDMGCYFSINPAVLKSQRHLTVLESIPIDRVLTESDGPVKFNGKQGSPALMPFLCKEIVKLLNIEEEQFTDTVFKNYKKFLK